MGQRNQFLMAARAEIGTVEGPKDNETKYGAFTKANFKPWCGSFVMWCANEVGLKIPNVVSTTDGAQKFQGTGRWDNTEFCMIFVSAPWLGENTSNPLGGKYLKATLGKT